MLLLYIGFSFYYPYKCFIVRSLPAVLAALPGLDVDHAHALPHALVLGRGVALK